MTELISGTVWSGRDVYDTGWNGSDVHSFRLLDTRAVS